ncbi:cystathionine gamma-synthase family protein [Curvibacter sp. RS43]|uniref:Cystathionine gamma-synthase family protein n=1 Tax=Curvibacter microcysteis TaxID=3026419 RepID=A0ABT5MGQ2_9BURK|nr:MULTISPECIES: cystathionine gamma-synthase family protein [unclassified Curvibacter]MDD0809894.1 cystathionine gamma-synthase family protein [Curvibacter sp. RS43]MDD0815069.1 cystathionine gamma-synthase family protein [Curvibacter sp. HBC28]
MTDSHTPGFTTQIVHADRRATVEHGAIHKPIHTSVQYGFDRVEDLIAVFQGTAKGGFNYARQGTPTTNALEAKLTQMEQGLGTITFATGMAGISAIFFTLLKAGDHLVASRYVFGNTNSVFGTLADLGISVTTVDATDAAQVAAAVQPNTRMVFVETIANPGTQVADLEGIGQLCRDKGLLYVVDNTVGSPYLFKPASVGAGLVVHSLTKSIGGHGNALGGSVTDTGLFDWASYPNIFPAYRKGDAKGWGLQQIRKKGLRDLGGTLSSTAAHQIAAGAETLGLRMDRTSATALALAQWLEQHPAIARVHYPMLASHPQHARAKKHFKAGSWLLSFELKNADDCLGLCNRLQLPIKATGLADTRTLIIPVAHTIFWEAGPEVRAAMGIGDSLIRLSVGLEEAEDLIADFAQALG